MRGGARTKTAGHRPGPPRRRKSHDPSHPPPPASAEFHAGQTIRIFIPFSAGGGTDTFGRLIAAHLGNHIPGNPTVIAENVTGAGGLLGSNEFARAGIDSPTGLMNMQGRITKGITDPVGPIEAIVAPEMFGTDYRPVPGFGGRGDHPALTPGTVRTTAPPPRRPRPSHEGRGRCGAR